MHSTENSYLLNIVYAQADNFREGEKSSFVLLGAFSRGLKKLGCLSKVPLCRNSGWSWFFFFWFSFLFLFFFYFSFSFFYFLFC